MGFHVVQCLPIHAICTAIMEKMKIEQLMFAQIQRFVRGEQHFVLHDQKNVSVRANGSLILVQPLCISSHILMALVNHRTNVQVVDGRGGEELFKYFQHITITIVLSKNNYIKSIN